MTNEEKINLRERALRLSIEIRNPYSGQAAMYMWAEHIYKFLSSDGLSLHEAEHMAKVVSLMDSGISEPEKSRNELESEPKIANEYIEYLEQFRPREEPPGEKNEIDWSRPQLVVHKELGNVIQTNGVHEGELFKGSELSGFEHCQKLWYSKPFFVYHGEIPQEQKTDGLDFLGAMKACKDGKNIRRSSWDIRYTLYHSNFQVFRNDNRPMRFSMEDFLATDWQIVK